MTDDADEPHDALELFICADEQGYSVRVLDRQTGVDHHTDEQVDPDHIITSFDGARAHRIIIDRERYRLNCITESENFYLETLDHFKEKRIALEDMDELEFQLDEEQLEQNQENRARAQRIEQTGLTMDRAIAVVEYGMHDPPSYTLVDAEILEGFIEAGHDPQARVDALPDSVLEPDLHRGAETRDDVKERLTGHDVLPDLVGVLQQAKHNEDERFMGRVERCSGLTDLHETLQEQDIELIDDTEIMRV